MLAKAIPAASCDKAKDNGRENVAGCRNPLAVLQQEHCLQAERGKGGETAEDADGDEGSSDGRDEQRSIWTGEAGKQSNDQRTEHVDGQRPPRKCAVRCFGNPGGHRVP